MGRVTTLLMLTLLCASASAQSLPQQHRDAIREAKTKQIFGSSEDLTLLQPDVILYRKIFELRENHVDRQLLLELDPIPMAQIYKYSELNLGQLISLSAAASGYDAEFHSQVNQSQMVKINSHANSLDAIAEYVGRVTDTKISVWPESRVVLVMPSESAQ